MAFVATLKERTVLGNKAVQVYECSSTVATGTIATGLKSISWPEVSIISCTAAELAVRINEDASGTAAYGTVAVSNMTSGDDFYIIVYGS